MLSYLKNIFGKDTSSWRSLIPVLESGKGEDLKSLLWNVGNRDISFMPLTISLLQKLAKPEHAKDGLKVYQTHQKGDFLLVIFEQGWITDDIPYSPLVINLKWNRIAGIMLPFNEIIPYLSNSESKAIGDLAGIWTLWIISKRFGS
jgi:hypothetical protein